jgi:fatty acid desaturase
MNRFSDARFPRRNLSDGALMLAFFSFLIGMNLSGAIRTHGSRWIYFIALVVFAALLSVAVAQFRLGLKSIAPDPPGE